MLVVKNYLYNVGYQLLILIVPLLTVPYIGRVLGPTGVGINAFTNSIVTYFLIAGTVGITLYGNREIAYARDDMERRSRTFWEIELLQVTTISIALCILGIYLLFVAKYRTYVICQSLFVIAGAFDISWLFMGLEDFKKTVLRNTMVKLVSLVAIFTLVKRPSDLATYILILSGSQLLGNLTLWPYLKKNIKFVPIANLHIWHHFKPAFLLFVPQVAVQIYLVVNKTMLGQFDSVQAAGYFDYSDKLVKMVLAIVTAPGTVLLPRISNLVEKKDMKKVRNFLYLSFDFVTCLAVPFMFGVAAIATSLAPWYFGPHFTVVGRLMMIESPIIIFIAWSNVIGQEFLIPTRRVKQFTISVTLGAVVSIVLNVPFILMLGVVGATITTVLSEASVALYQMYVVRRDLKMHILLENFIKYLVAGVVMFAVVYFLNLTMKITVLNLGIQIVIGVLLYAIVLLLLRPTILKNFKMLFQDN